MRIQLIRVWPVACLLALSLAAPAAAAVIDGTDGPDVLVGTKSADTIRGYAGNDILRGRAGGDRLYGGANADRLLPGRDLKKDVLFGGPGPDRIKAKWPDVVYAGTGNDTVRVIRYSWMFPQKIQCGPGRDTLITYTEFAGIRGCERIVEP